MMSDCSCDWMGQITIICETQPSRKGRLGGYWSCVTGVERYVHVLIWQSCVHEVCSVCLSSASWIVISWRVHSYPVHLRPHLLPQEWYQHSAAGRGGGKHRHHRPPGPSTGCHEGQIDIVCSWFDSAVLFCVGFLELQRMMWGLCPLLGYRETGSDKHIFNALITTRLKALYAKVMK